MENNIFIYVPEQYRQKTYLGKNNYTKPINTVFSNRVGVTTQKTVLLNQDTVKTINYTK